MALAFSAGVHVPKKPQGRYTTVNATSLTRRELLQRMGGFATLWAVRQLAPVSALANGAALRRGAIAPEPGAVDLVIDQMLFTVNGHRGKAVAVNGSVPGPLLRLREGEEAVIRVDNRLGDPTSIHWHGVLVPPEMDGVPGVSFAGIPPRSIFTYRFPVRQSGTYWAHAHDPTELIGLYFPLVIDPVEPEPYQYERDYVVMFSDWSFESPGTILSRLKKQAGYYNFQRRTGGDLFRDIGRQGLWTTLKDRLAWAKMRMDPTDFADVTGSTYHYLLNGRTPDADWTGLFDPGERVRLRFIASGAMTSFDVRIPDLRMTVVQADGQDVQPVEVDEFRLGPGETLDVIVRPEDRAYAVFAESLDRSGYTSGTLAPRAGMRAPLPPHRRRPLRTMQDMGMPMASMDDMPGMGHEGHGGMGAAVRHGPDTHGAGNGFVPVTVRSRLDEPGSGFETSAGKVLVYTDLRSPKPQPDQREPQREIELHITGNMQRYIWSFDGKKYADARTPIPFRYGERLRLVLVNDTMMEHPIHLHGMWMELENGGASHQPRKHTISVKPAERLTVAITADAPGQWALHCHLLLHMEVGMFRVVEVSPAPEVSS